MWFNIYCAKGTKLYIQSPRQHGAGFLYAGKGAAQAVAEDKQQQFAKQYIIDFDATQAVLRAGYKCKSRESAAAMGSRLLRNVKVQKMVSDNIQDRIRRTHITQDRVVLELAAIAFSDMTKDTNGLTWKDKLKALELLGKHLGMFTEKMDIEGTTAVVISGNDLIED